jgi:hypothetical protein
MLSWLLFGAWSASTGSGALAACTSPPGQGYSLAGTSASLYPPKHGPFPWPGAQRRTSHWHPPPRPFPSCHRQRHRQPVVTEPRGLQHPPIYSFVYIIVTPPNIIVCVYFRVRVRLNEHRDYYENRYPGPGLLHISMN